MQFPGAAYRLPSKTRVEGEEGRSTLSFWIAVGRPDEGATKCFSSYFLRIRRANRFVMHLLARNVRLGVRPKPSPMKDQSEKTPNTPLPLVFHGGGTFTLPGP